ncbi:FtsK/SpoIIIE domain-containing protein [Holdemania filiformis]|uniref:FtsK/SpoIIIE domain-containing protein n=1 Tax=Holdemania filiformis TaxID=61171 RepID=UPI0022E7F44D|nr:FtsK/SpoIIIE domain-containing protein [Holdemania filiformis]
MIVCILWQHRLAVRHVCSQRGLFFAVEADGVLAITRKGEGWQVQISETLQFLDSSRRCRLIKGRHDELCYLPFYEKIDLYYYFEDAGYDQYTLYQRPQGRWMLSEEALTNTCGNQDEPWAMLDFDQNVAEEKAMFPGMIVNGVHQRQTRLEAGMRLQFAAVTVLIHPAFIAVNNPGMRLKIKLKPLRGQTLTDWMYQPSDKLALSFHPAFQFYPADPQCSLTLPQGPPVKFRPMTFSVMTIGPSLMMGAASITVGLSLGQGAAGMMVLMPAVMMFSAVFWPLAQLTVNVLLNRRDRRRQKQWLTGVLEDWEKTCQAALRETVTFLTRRYPDAERVIAQIEEQTVFDTGADHPLFGKLCLGRQRLTLIPKMNLETLDLRNPADQEVKRQIEVWQTMHSFSAAAPLPWDLFEFDQIGLVCDEKSLPAFFNTVLMTFAVHHQAQNTALAWLGPISKDIFETLCWLPQLYDDQGLRRIWTNQDDWDRGRRQIQDIMIPVWTLVSDPGAAVCFGTPKAKSCVWQWAARISDLRLAAQRILMIEQGHGRILTRSGQLVQEFDVDFSYAKNFRESALSLYRAEQRSRGSHCQVDFQSLLAQPMLSSPPWQEAAGLTQLRIPLGLDERGQPVILDLHEKGQGPHGLIAGMTGSGKSRLLETLVLSAAWHYSPDQLQFAIIDYKGGSLIEQLRFQGRLLPHCCAELNNVAENGVERSLIYLRQECERRQRYFAQAQTALKQPVSDLDHYRQLCLDHPQLPRLAHCVLIIDEFAELKQSQPEFMQDLIQICRIGRSLGLHLILATQRPAGIVDEQMWSNFNFKLCLKVAQKQDSQELLHCDKALRLSRPGQFLLLSQQDLVQGQCAWLGGKQTPDPVVRWLDFRLKPIRETQHGKNASLRQSEALMAAIIREADRRGLSAPPLWPPLPTAVELDVLKRQTAGLVLGIGDDPLHRATPVIVHPLAHGLLISEEAAAQRAFLQCLVQSAGRFDETAEFVVLDPLDQLPQFLAEPAVIEVLSFKHPEWMERFFSLLDRGLRQRRSAEIPLLIVVLQLGAILDRWDHLALFQRLLEEGPSLNLYLLCAEKQISRLPLRLAQNLRIRYILGPAAPAQLGEALERTWTQPLAAGKGLFFKESVMDFVLARPLPPPAEMKPKRWQLPRLPERLPRSWLKKKAVFLGVDPILCQPVYATLQARQHLVVTGYDASLCAARIRQLGGPYPIVETSRQSEAEIFSFFERETPFILVAAAHEIQRGSWRRRVDFSLTLWSGPGLRQQLFFPVPAAVANLTELESMWIQGEQMQRLREIK